MTRLNTNRCVWTVAILALLGLPAIAVAQGNGAGSSYQAARASIERQLEESLAELAALRERIVTERDPLSAELTELQSLQAQRKLEAEQASKDFDARTVENQAMLSEVERQKKRVATISKYISDYGELFESRLHIGELPNYQDKITRSRLALSSQEVTEAELYSMQMEVLQDSISRLEGVLGGTRFEGTAVNQSGDVVDGTYLLIGPTAVFSSKDGKTVGTAEQRLGSLAPTVLVYPEDKDAALAASLVSTGTGSWPLDPTGGDAHKMAATKETILDEVKKGGALMWPIGILAGLGLLVSLYKWGSLSLVRRPSKRRMKRLLQAVADQDQSQALAEAEGVGGPVGRMLVAGVEHLDQPKELIEEVMYEKMIKSRLSLQGLLPFIAICAASAPLLGLLGTVTGIISTFKSITVFGSSDVTSLSGGISEALITTKFGLCVAIPSLLLHAFLSRKARGILGKMELAAVALVNQVSKTPFKPELQRDSVHTQVEQALSDLLQPMMRPEQSAPIAAAAEPRPSSSVEDLARAILAKHGTEHPVPPALKEGAAHA